MITVTITLHTTTINHWHNYQAQATRSPEAPRPQQHHSRLTATNHLSTTAPWPLHRNYGSHSHHNGGFLSVTAVKVINSFIGQLSFTATTTWHANDGLGHFVSEDRFYLHLDESIVLFFPRSSLRCFFFFPPSSSAYIYLLVSWLSHIRHY